MKKRYIFFLLFEFFTISPILTQGRYFNILSAIVQVYVLYLTNKIEQEKANNNPLTKNEKIQVIITEILDPILAGAFYYYCWKNKLPKKASQANKYSWIIFGVWMIVAVPLIIFILGLK